MNAPFTDRSDASLIWHPRVAARMGYDWTNDTPHCKYTTFQYVLYCVSYCRVIMDIPRARSTRNQTTDECIQNCVANGILSFASLDNSLEMFRVFGRLYYSTEGLDFCLIYALLKMYNAIRSQKCILYALPMSDVGASGARIYKIVPITCIITMSY